MPREEFEIPSQLQRFADGLMNSGVAREELIKVIEECRKGVDLDQASRQEIKRVKGQIFNALREGESSSGYSGNRWDRELVKAGGKSRARRKNRRIRQG